MLENNDELGSKFCPHEELSTQQEMIGPEIVSATQDYLVNYVILLSLLSVPWTVLL